MNNGRECSISHNNISTCQSFLRCHFAHLKKQMAQQRAEYEAINKEMDIEVKDLHSKLDQQRQWHRLMEIKICNVERACKDAERRNETLQKEMEDFFCTFGKLTSEKKLLE
ncbi:ARHGAP24: Rho GTPase-activating protein 24 [Crotalus adamanteus]|uniref:ARHGAP24: Rho GTPase-activating protein 24 n=1 Tax=Crotalus adamanteus TaxID=8729 RepID=A0AAW1BXT3_CROAD